MFIRRRQLPKFRILLTVGVILVLSLLGAVVLHGLLSRHAHTRSITGPGCRNTSCATTHANTANIPSTPAQPSTTAGVTYLSLGNVPASGLAVGATFYGALEEPQNGTYVVSNSLQGGQKNGGAYGGYDDNGEGACGGKYNNLTDQATWAEDKLGTILGNLPCGTKLELSYQGHKVIAEKADSSNGGCPKGQTTCADNGTERQVDLWWQTAKALCFSDQPGILTIHVVPQSVPTTTIQPYAAANTRSYAVCS